MKTILLAVSVMAFSFFTVAQTRSSQLTTETISVWGNCGMCKSTIEKAAKNAGASYAVWNEVTKELKVKYSASKTNGAKIQTQVAAVGYDTQDMTASDSVYNQLHGCCKYERKTTSTQLLDKKETCCNKEQCVGKTECMNTKACCTKDSTASCCKNCQ